MMKKRGRLSSRQAYIVFCTVPTASSARKISDFLVKSRLAACVNIIPAVNSIFRWKGKLERAKELLLIIKTRRTRLTQLEREIKRLHCYEVPEMIGLPIRWGHGPYIDWVLNSINQ